MMGRCENGVMPFRKMSTQQTVLMFNNPTLRKNVIAGYTGFDCIKQHFGYRKIETSVLNKPEKSRNMIVAPKGDDSKEKHLGENSTIKHADIILNLDV